MKKNFLLCLIFLTVLVSCNGASTSKKTAKAVTKTDSCISNPKHTYEVYIPKRNKSLKKLPLLIILDPHASGKFALNKFKQAATQYPVILVASNLIKNGFTDYSGAIQALITDVRQKYPVNSTLFISGFSGGARMALSFAQTYQIDGLILCGALDKANKIRAAHCPVISISGTDDFNFIETAQYLFQEQLIPGNLNIELTNASHNWPDNLTLANAFGFLYFSSRLADLPLPEDSQIHKYCEYQQARIDSLRNREDFIKAMLVARNLSKTKPFDRDKIFISLYSDLKTNPEYTNQLDQLKNCLKYEIGTRQSYLNAFIKKDTLWWKNEIETINKEIKAQQEPYLADMYRRIKAFLGIACYSLGKKAIQGENAQMLNKIIPVYYMLEPENPEMFYFSAFPFFWQGNNAATLSRLRKAREAGFKDKSRLKKDFGESITSKLY